MRCLGIDYGEKRIGFALSDEEGRLAFPFAVIKNEGIRRIMRAIQEMIRAEGITIIIVGVPRALSGADTAETKIILRFIQALKEKIRLPVEEENEILTTRIAREYSTKNIDASAAALILQSYLDKKCRVKNNTKNHPISRQFSVSDKLKIEN